MTRADVFLVDNGYATSRAEAQAAILDGLVRAGGRVVAKASDLIADGTAIEYAKPHGYVSRGGVKLASAFERFAISPAGLTCIDVGASTGGFTQVLLERGALRVYAVDVGHGQLHSKLRSDPRIVNLEGLNARELTSAHVAEPVDGITADVSFISLKLVLEPALKLVRAPGWLVALVKPQFEAGRGNVGKGGIVKDGKVRDEALQGVVTWIGRQPGWSVLDTMDSPIAGGDGNREYLLAAAKS